MRIRKMFSIPDGEKVTEKALRRVLLSSICSILLCMTCLVSTTWAWFTVSIVNEDNVIAIAEHPDVIVTENEAPLVSGTELKPGDHTICIVHANDPDDLKQKSILHVTFSVDGVVAGRIVLNEGNAYETKITVETDKACIFTWDAAWFAPDGADILVANTIKLTTVEPSTEPSTEPPTEPSTEPSTEPPTEPSTEPSTEPATEAATEPETEPATELSTEEPTQPEETPTEEPTEDTTDPTIDKTVE